MHAAPARWYLRAPRMPVFLTACTACTALPQVHYTACIDRMWDYKQLAARGALTVNSTTYV